MFYRMTHTLSLSPDIIQRMAHRRIVRSPADSFSSEELDLLLELKPAFEREFRERFGRDLRPDEPVFWSLSRSGKELVPMTEDEIREILDKYLDELEAALRLGYASFDRN